METAAAPIRPPLCAQPPELPRRSRPLSSYRKPVPTELELELRQQRRANTQSIFEAGPVQGLPRTALELPRSTDHTALTLCAHDANAAVAPPHGRSVTWHGPLLPRVRVQQQEPPPIQLAAWFWQVLERIKQMGRTLLAN